MTTHFSQSLLGSLDTVIAGASLNALASGSYALGPAINNTPTDGTTISYDLADLTITLSSAVTTGGIGLRANTAFATASALAVFAFHDFWASSA